MPEIRKGYCEGCPFDYGSEATEIAYNLGCLPSTGELSSQCEQEGKAWACHSDPSKVCCGYAARFPDRKELPLLTVQGVHHV